MATDALSDVLEHVGIRGTVFCRAEVGAPWGLSTRGMPMAIFHVIVRGAGWIRVEDEPPRAWRAGDVLLLPHGHAHVMSDDPETPPVPLGSIVPEEGEDGLACVVEGGSGPRTSILCGSFDVGPSAEELLLGPLPALIHVQSGAAREAAWLDATLRLLADEVGGARPGSETVVARLAEILLVHALRAWLAERAEEERGWLAGLGDPVVSRALGTIHRRPSEDWTAERLARDCGVSRTVLYDRFRASVGATPAAYLAAWRMQLARRHLRAHPDHGMMEVATAVGYASEAAFSRAFKRVVGQSPSAWRRSA